MMTPTLVQEHGVLPVLYASTWLLTAFSCPFSTAFSGRLIDTMLLERRTHILLRAALAVLGDCEAKLLELNDFEELITFLKVPAAAWLSCITACDVVGVSVGGEFVCGPELA